MRLLKKIAFTVSIGLLLILPALASIGNAASTDVTPISTIFDGTARDVYVDGSYAYVSAGYGGLIIYDISTPTTPIKIGQNNELGFVESVAISGDYAYVAAGEDGFISLDISDPTDPVKLDDYRDSGDEEHATEIIVNGDLAYLADGNDGFEIISVLTPDNLRRRSEVDGVSIYFEAIELVGTDLYAIGSRGLKIYDVSNEYFPSGPIGSFNDGGINTDIAIAGNYAFLADLEEGLEIVNITDISNITQVGQYDLSFKSLVSVTVDGNYAYVISHDGFEIIDVTDVTNPVKIGGVDNGYGMGIDINGNYAYVCEFERGVGIYDISIKSSPSEFSRIDDFMIIEEITVGNHIYAAMGEEGLVQIDASDPADLSSPAVYTAAPIYKAEIHEGYIYGVSEGELKVISETTMTAVTNYMGNFVDVALHGSRAYIFYYLGFDILDISIPTSPVFLGNYTHEGVGLIGGVADDTYLYAIDPDEGIYVIDITTATAPTVVGEIESYYVDEIVVENNMAYFVSRNLGLTVVDMADPTLPVAVSSYRSVLRSPYRGIIARDNAVLIGDLNGILIMDVSDPTVAAVVDEYEDVSVVDLRNFGDYVVYTSGDNGINLIRVNVTFDKKIPGFSTFVIIGTLLGVSAILVIRRNKK
ncbi:MAG: hypothetical protein EU530_07190 [Promethearchaeota archaeon]|nr:MAG: hypothetical protein EU530_07190 [Candidatus Lokiarchaeota archaeon]